ncbi:MAG TPA: sulfatase [Verrucomicrobiales bacterium]|nr:sulfatase [Verrucomicrobiales bacterium]
MHDESARVVHGSKQTSMKYPTILLTLLLIGSVSHAQQKPNVLFIAVDDLNDFPTFSNRYPDAKTPHMDALAKQGIVFSNAHCQAPLCGPSRASIMTSMLPDATLGFGSRQMDDKQVVERARELGTEVLHSYFAKNGYKTMSVGKLFHDGVPKGTVDAAGGDNGKRGGFRSPAGLLRKNWPQKGTQTDWAAIDFPEEEFPDHVSATWAVEQIKSAHDKPFMLMVGFLRPHNPWYVTQQWFDLYDRDKISLPPYRKDDFNDLPEGAEKFNVLSQMPRTDWAIEKDQWRDIVHAYLACMSYADHQVGRVLDALKASAHAENTIIVLWSDHGYHMGEKNTFQKHTLWERSSHVPLIFAGPGVKAGLRSHRVVSLMDVYPTLVDLCGLPANPKNEGRSLTPLIEKPDLEWPYTAITEWQNGHAVQSETHRYIHYPDGGEELYDHQTDIHEWTNLAKADDPGIQAIKAKLKANLPKVTTAPEVKKPKKKKPKAPEDAKQ